MHFYSLEFNSSFQVWTQLGPTTINAKNIFFEPLVVTIESDSRWGRTMDPLVA